MGGYGLSAGLTQAILHYSKQPWAILHYSKLPHAILHCSTQSSPPVQVHTCTALWSYMMPSWLSLLPNLASRRVQKTTKFHWAQDSAALGLHVTMELGICREAKLLGSSSINTTQCRSDQRCDLRLICRSPNPILP